jgi:hypothetical protein
MAMRWLQESLVEAGRLAGVDATANPDVWLTEVRACLASLAKALVCLEASGLYQGVAGKYGQDLAWLLNLLEQQGRETVVLQQIVKIS